MSMIKEASKEGSDYGGRSRRPKLGGKARASEVTIPSDTVKADLESSGDIVSDDEAQDKG